MSGAIKQGLYALRDGFFCKTGHEWTTYESGRSRSYRWPFPTTLRGMLRGAWGRSKEGSVGKGWKDTWWRTETEEIHLLVSFPMCRAFGSQGAWGREERLWPCPKDALAVEGEESQENQGFFKRLQPVPSKVETMGGEGRGAKAKTFEEAREGLWFPHPSEKAKPLPMPEWWTERDFLTWLQGSDVIRKSLTAYPSLVSRPETHLAIEGATLTNQESMLFSMDLMESFSKMSASSEASSQESLYEWALALAWSIPQETPARLFPEGPLLLGGRRKVALPLPLGADLLAWPEDKAFDQAFRKGSLGLRLIAVTPTLFERGWLPDGFEAVATSDSGGGKAAFEGELPCAGKAIRVRLLSALVPRPQHVSGWDVVGNAPKKTLRLVAPGSVYFMQKVDGQAFSYEEIKSLWLAGWGGRQEDGLGRLVPGLWEPSPLKKTL